MLMGSHHHKVAILVPDDKLGYSKNFFVRSKRGISTRLVNFAEHVRWDQQYEYNAVDFLGIKPDVFSDEKAMC